MHKINFIVKTHLYIHIYIIVIIMLKYSKKKQMIYDLRHFNYFLEIVLGL